MKEEGRIKKPISTQREGRINKEKEKKRAMASLCECTCERREKKKKKKEEGQEREERIKNSFLILQHAPVRFYCSKG